MIVNLIGPPGAGKSTFASRFVLEHPYFTLCDIAGYRAETSSEEEAWYKLERDVALNRDVILETCGLNHQLKGIFNRTKDRHVYTVLIMGELKELQRRVRERKRKRIPPFKYRLRDEVNTVEWVIEHLDETPIAPELIVNTVKDNADDDYNFITNAIIRRRLMVGYKP